MSNTKRQRQKELRRARIEEEMRVYKAKKRRRTSILIFGLILLISALVTQVFFKKKEPATTTSAIDCPVTKAPAMVINPAKKYQATMETSQGTLVIDLDAKESPKTVNSFVALARCKFFDGLKFHRIVKDFAIQGGDPKGDGSGGPPYKVTEAPPAGVTYTRGVVAMAKSGGEPAGTSGSQFFIVPSDAAAQRLTPDYALLGKVSSGLDTVDKLQNVPVKANPAANGEVSLPDVAPVITKVTIAEPVGSSSSPEAPASPAASPAGTPAGPAPGTSAKP